MENEESGEVEFRSTNYTSFGSYLKATMEVIRASFQTSFKTGDHTLRVHYQSAIRSYSTHQRIALPKFEIMVQHCLRAEPRKRIRFAS